ncbi:MAG: efflux RND transporter periplasmic adaptor subunit [Bacteroidales bacterium]|nr:efflux RND transporter periplasmic adaptor subunit [Bacteroidales bacterium]
MKNLYFIFTLLCSVIFWGCEKSEHNHAHDEKVIHSHSHEDEEEIHKNEHAHEHNHSHEHAHSEIHKDKDVVVFSHKQSENANLRVKKIEYAPFSNIIKCSGDIVSSPSDAIYIVAPTSGVILFGSPYPVDGKHINGGDKLFTISSSNLQDGDVAYRAKIAYENAKRDYERAQELVKDKIISEKDFADIKVEYETAKAAYEAINGVDGNGSAVIAPEGGYISQISVNNGDFVSMGQTIAMISKNKELLLRADIEHEDFIHLPQIKSANFKLPFDERVYKLSDMSGRVLSYGKYITHGENFIPITFEFTNKEGLIPGSYADIYILTDIKEDALAVPESAICEEQGLYYLFVALDCEHFRKTEVTLGESNGEMVRIVKGINSGDLVVTEGVHQLKAASRKSVIPEGHSHSH